MRCVLAAALALLVWPAAARAQDAQTVENVTRIWETQWVYADPAAATAGDLDANALEQQIGRTDAQPLYLAILPASAADGASADELLAALKARSGREGTFALALDNELRAVTDRGFDADHELAESVRRNPDSTQGALALFIHRVELAKGPEPEPSRWWLWLLSPVLVFFVLATAYAVLVTLRRRRVA